MKQEPFHIKTTFRDDTYYVFDGENTHIRLSDTTRTVKKKYGTVCGGENLDGALDTAFVLCGLKHVTLDFGGAVLTLHGRIQPFLIDECEDITIKNVTVAYERAVFTELDVVSNSGTELRAKIKDKFPCRVEDGYFIPYAEEWEDRTLHIEKCHFLQAFDKTTHDGRGLMVMYLGENIVQPSSPPAPNIPHIRVRGEGDEIVFMGKFPKHWDDSMSIVIEHEPRDKSSVAMYHSKDITLENYRILNGAGMGFYAVYTENITLRGVKLFCDELSHGINTNSADAVHFVACKGTVTLTDSILEGMIDDALNVHANFYHVVQSKSHMICARRSELSHGLGAYTEVFGKGDTIAVYHGRTMEEKARFVIQDAHVTGEWTTELTVDGDTDGLCEEDIIENLSTNPALIFRNTRFAKANSHLRLQTRGKALIEHCDFTLPILLTGDMNYWFESSPINDLTVRDCTFRTPRAVIRICPEFTSTDAAPYYHRGVKILNNVFDNPTALVASHADGIRFLGNTSADGQELRIETKGCGDVVVE